jgi:hypothetical protein
MLDDLNTLAGTRTDRRDNRHRPTGLTPPPFSAIVPTIRAQLQPKSINASTSPATSLVDTLSTSLAQKSATVLSTAMCWISSKPALSVALASVLATGTNVMIAVSQVTCSRCWYTKVLPALLGPAVIGAVATSGTWIAGRSRKIKELITNFRQRPRK